MCSDKQEADTGPPPYQGRPLVKAKQGGYLYRIRYGIERLVLIRDISDTQGREKLLQASMTC